MLLLLFFFYIYFLYCYVFKHKDEYPRNHKIELEGGRGEFCYLKHYMFNNVESISINMKMDTQEITRQN